YFYVAYRKLWSFPTRRSSDLKAVAASPDGVAGASARPLVPLPVLAHPANRTAHSAAVSGRSILASLDIRTTLARRPGGGQPPKVDRKSTRLNSSHVKISYAVF